MGDSVPSLAAWNVLFWLLFRKMAVGRLVTPRPRSRFTRGSLYRVRLNQNRFESWRENQGIVPLQSIRRYLPGFRPEYLQLRFGCEFGVFKMKWWLDAA